MTKLIGVMLVMAGTVLFILGLDASSSLTDKLSKFFESTPTDRSLWLEIAGAAVGGMGLVLIFQSPRRR